MLNLQSMNPVEIDTIMSLIPEASPQMMSLGTPCVDQNGKTFISLGSINEDQAEKKAHQQVILSKCSAENPSHHMSALYFDVANPQRQEVVTVSLNEAVPLLDLASTSC